MGESTRKTDSMGWCSKTIMELIRDALTTHSVASIASHLGLCAGTVRRWLELNDVPPNYRFDLLRLLGKPIDYGAYSSKEKDQFFTPPEVVSRCWALFRETVPVALEDYTFIEPSAGDGKFLDVLPSTTIAMDIEPRDARIQCQDYLAWTPPETPQRYIVFGNPPFGLRGHLALQFLNHSASFADYVCFILPQLFESDGKGSPRKRVKGLNLLASEKVSGLYQTPEGSSVEVHGVFQIWSKHTTNPAYAIVPVSQTTFTIYSLSDGGTPGTTRNKSKLTACDIYLPSTCFGASAMRAYDSFEALPNRKGYGVVFHANRESLVAKSKATDWAAVSFLSTNSAYNLRTSLIASTLSTLASSEETP